MNLEEAIEILEENRYFIKERKKGFWFWKRTTGKFYLDESNPDKTYFDRIYSDWINPSQQSMVPLHILLLTFDKTSDEIIYLARKLKMKAFT
jgi:hypothetical protein